MASLAYVRVTLQYALICFVNFPGTNWTMEIVDAIQHIDNLDILKERSLMEKMPMLELGPSTHPDLVEDGIVGIPSNILTYFNNAPSPRRMPTHLLPEFSPTQLFTKKPKTVIVNRNPKDCLASLRSWHASVRFLKPISWDEIFEQYMRGHTVYGDYCHFTKAWAKYKNEPWVLWMQYEDMKMNHKGAVKRIAEFMGKTLTEGQIDEVVRVTSFDYMKEANKTIKGRDVMLRPEGAWQRKGVSGDWKNTFTVAQNEIFDKHYAENIKGYEDLKYKF
ncbi:sulfotransferase 1C2-like [Ptychodera flava]|uniref:sulfotransferase 1C2-like n=1 Tax=Ptychodera flava TaxID=63121 RepID=UPI00396A73A6